MNRTHQDLQVLIQNLMGNRNTAINPVEQNKMRVPEQNPNTEDTAPRQPSGTAGNYVHHGNQGNYSENTESHPTQKAPPRTTTPINTQKQPPHRNLVSQVSPPLPSGQPTNNTTTTNQDVSTAEQQNKNQFVANQACNAVSEHQTNNGLNSQTATETIRPINSKITQDAPRQDTTNEQSRQEDVDMHQTPSRDNKRQQYKQVEKQEAAAAPTQASNQAHFNLRTPPILKHATSSRSLVTRMEEEEATNSVKSANTAPMKLQDMDIHDDTQWATVAQRSFVQQAEQQNRSIKNRGGRGGRGGAIL